LALLGKNQRTNWMKWNEPTFKNYDIGKNIDYRCDCEDGRFRFLQIASCVTISNLDSLSSSETGVHLGIRGWKKQLFEWARRQKAIGGIYVMKKWRAETLQTGSEFDQFQPWLNSGIFKCISWPNGSFLGAVIRAFWGGSEDLSYDTNVAS
jgi:hypothetical protein